MSGRAGKAISLGDRAPNFVAPTTDGEIELYRWKGGCWAVLLTHPAELSPVLATELLALSRMKAEFDRRDARVIALSIDSVVALARWLAEVDHSRGAGQGYPLVGDSVGAVAAKYGLMHPGSLAESQARRVFVIDPDHTVRLTIDYPPCTGLSCAEILRVLDALQLADRFDVGTPSDWRPGSRVIVPPTVDDETAIERFGGFDAEHSRLRYVDDPLVKSEQA